MVFLPLREVSKFAYEAPTLFASAEVEWIYVIKMTREKNESFLLYVFVDTDFLFEIHVERDKRISPDDKIDGNR